MGIGTWLGETLVEAGRTIATKLQAFGRTRTKEQQQSDLEQWNANHTPLHRDAVGRCAVCGKPRVTDAEHCPGPVKKWRAVRPETPKCEALFRHEELPGYFVQGCEICDPGRTRKARS